MKGLGTIVNVAAVLIGGGIGLIIKTGLKKRFQDILMQACGLATVFIGISGALSEMFTVSKDGAIASGNTMLLVCSLVLGGLIGEFLNIEKRLDSFGEKLKTAVKAQGDNSFVDGFVTASLVICVGAMAIVGSIQDGLTGDYSMLFAKALLDLIIVMVFASSMGIGTLFSALPLGIYQGAITLCAALIAPYLSDTLISGMSCVGSVLIFCVGYNLAFGKKIRVGNLLPAIVISAVYTAIF